ncbi:MAG: hypothetical protein P4L53_26545 [Candidatus Obscuribacterales bacterium]|nr:hypothetical protein [Candidatus Obscuribacterales bacterium]
MAGKLDIAIGIGKEALENPLVREAAGHAVSAAERLLQDTMPQSMMSAAKRVEGLARDSFSDFSSANYRHIPVRSLATEIRTGGDVSMRSVDGPSRIVFDQENKVQHVLFNKNATDIERADHLQTAGYANLIHNDVLANEAASKVMGQSAGFISHPIERFATQEEMQKNAIDGARAYVGRDAANANRFTAYLTERFGAQTEETQAWGRHIVNGDGVENIFSTTLRPPTSILDKGLRKP